MEIKYTDKQLTELAAIQISSAKADLASRLIGVVPIKYIWKNVLNLSDKEIESFGDFGECGPECGHDEDDEKPWK